MPDIHTLIKGGVLHHLKQDSAVNTLVPPGRIYGQMPVAKPHFPFIRYGAGWLTPFAPSGFDGASAHITLHAFTEGSKQQAAEDKAGQIAAAIITAMQHFTDSRLSLLDCTLLQSRIMPEEGGRAHALVEFMVIAAAA